MAKVITTIAADNGMDYGSILSFKTKNYTGIWYYSYDSFVLIKNSDIEFNFNVIQKCEDLKELYDKVFEECGEHITEVFDKCDYTFMLD